MTDFATWMRDVLLVHTKLTVVCAVPMQGPERALVVCRTEAIAQSCTATFNARGKAVR
jgi:hypothetical protein